MMDRLIASLTIYLPTTPYVFVYMLQQVENNGKEFMGWINRMPDYRRVMHRKKLVRTKKVLIQLLVAYGIWCAAIAAIVLFIMKDLYLVSTSIFVCTPILIAYALTSMSKIGSSLLIVKRRKDYAAATEKLRAHKAVKIVVLGSYGKTSAKELLATILGSGKNVAATPGNMNVPISHARWINTKLTGDEDVLIFELGEGDPGDIKRFCELLIPDIAVVTGVAPNHLDHYGSIEVLKADLVSVEDYVKPQNLYEAEQAAKELAFKHKPHVYGITGTGDIALKNIHVSLTGTSFDLIHSGTKTNMHTRLIGEHNAPVIALCYRLGLSLDISPKDLETGVSQTMPFEHRMQAREVSGAWLIDDTYNGNLEGIRAGLELLRKVEAKRKMYVTPGLVEQGEETEKVHTEIGHLIAVCNPDVVVLMKNSVSDIMKTAIEAKGYKGIIRIEDDPLSFYTNIQYELAGGDVVLMQNDWTDNYV